MAARKLQSEIERTLKKVQEGVEVFEGYLQVFDKIQQSTNQTQKEKLEVDLKSQIKKLQRLRDQIKTWLQSNDIKDKQPLIDHRKLIETQMEKFKACEKEMKTKAFSKTGLSAATKLDPKEQLKVELCNWITTMVDELGRQVEQTEAEVETLQLTKKKKGSEATQRLEDLETLNERRNWHVGRLELILRLLENGNLQTDAVSSVKDDIAYFVESNTEEDFEEDEGIYDDLNLEEEEDLYGVGGDDIQSSHDSTSVADEPASAPAPRTPAKETYKPKEEDRSPTASKAPTTTTTTTTKAPPITSPPARKPTLDSTTPRPIITQTPTRSVSGPAPTPAPVPRSVPAPLPPIRYAAAAAAANAATMTAAAVTTPTTPASVSAPAPVAPAPTLAPAPTPPAAVPVATPVSAPAPPPGFSAAPPSAPSTAADSRQASVASSPEASKASLPDQSQPASVAPSPLVAPSVLAQASPALSAASTNPNGAASSPSGAPSVSSQPYAASPISTASAPLPPADVAVTETPASPKAVGAAEPRLPSSLADLVTSFESAKQKSLKRDGDLSGVNKILDAGFANVPQPLDAEKPKYYIPRNPYATPSYYPQEPSSQFANPALFAKFDIDTLFYIFYYCPGTYLQFLAASELKKQSWRFHKQYLTWFQRANEPQQITDEYEQGVYLYFDWEGSWCQRRKSDFTFHYKYLDST